MKDSSTEGGDKAACRQLVDSFMPAIGGVARRVDAGGRVQRTELMQEGVAGLLFAAKRYDPRLKTGMDSGRAHGQRGVHRASHTERPVLIAHDGLRPAS